MINLSLDPDSKVPPFEQLRQQLIEQIMARALPEGKQLPTVRGLAAELGLAANTVARTYRELEAEGYVNTRGRNGTFVAPVAPPTDEILTRVEEITTAYVSQMQQLGMGTEAIIRAIHRYV